MTVHDQNGTAITKATLQALMTDVTPTENKVLRLDDTNTYYQHYTLPGHTVIDGDRQLAFQPGLQYTQAQIDALYPPALITSITQLIGGTAPTNCPAAGGTVLVFKGDHLTGITAITFGGTAGTNLTVVSTQEVHVTTPAKTAGSYTVAITDDSGAVDANSISLTNAVTFV